MQHLTTVALNIAEHGWVPDAAIRRGIRQLLRRRLHEIEAGGAPSAAQKQMQLVERMRAQALSQRAGVNSRQFVLKGLTAALQRWPANA